MKKRFLSLVIAGLFFAFQTSVSFATTPEGGIVVPSGQIEGGIVVPSSGEVQSEVVSKKGEVYENGDLEIIYPESFEKTAQVQIEVLTGEKFEGAYTLEEIFAYLVTKGVSEAYQEAFVKVCFIKSKLYSDTFEIQKIQKEYDLLLKSKDSKLKFYVSAYKMEVIKIYQTVGEVGITELMLDASLTMERECLLNFTKKFSKLEISFENKVEYLQTSKEFWNFAAEGKLLVKEGNKDKVEKIGNYWFLLYAQSTNLNKAFKAL